MRGVQRSAAHASRAMAPVCHRVLRNASRMILILLPGQQRAYAAQFLAAQFLIFQKIEHQQLRRITEEAAHQLPYGGAAGLVTVHQRAIDEGAAFLGFGVAEESLFLQNSQGGEHRVVGQSEFAGQGVGHFGHVASPFSQTTSISRNSASVRFADFFRANAGLRQLRN